MESKMELFLFPHHYYFACESLVLSMILKGKNGLAMNMVVILETKMVLSFKTHGKLLLIMDDLIKKKMTQAKK